MPKKHRASGHGRTETVASDDESVLNDNASVVSNASSGSYMKDGEGPLSGEDTGEDISQDTLFEDKLKEAMDLATQKSAQGRTTALEAISKALIKKYIPEFVEDCQATLLDIIERSLKKGKSSELMVATNLAILLCVQLDSMDSVQEVYNCLKPVAVTKLLDNSESYKVRSSLASCLGLLTFLSGDLANFENGIEALGKVFRQPASSAEHSLLATAALTSWTLLSTELPFQRCFQMLIDNLEMFDQLLDSSDVGLRIATGEAMVVVYENACGHDEQEAGIALEGLIPKLQELAKDSHKYRSKKDRKEQKSSFRDFIKTIDEGEGFYEKVAINRREVLEIDSWSHKIQYECLCKVLGSGMNLHLSENEFVRDIFGLGAPVPAASALQSVKPSKQERVIANQLASKIRSQARGKNRNKRSQVV